MGFRAAIRPPERGAVLGVPPALVTVPSGATNETEPGSGIASPRVLKGEAVS